jgi:hypothetical protein
MSGRVDESRGIVLQVEDRMGKIEEEGGGR